MVAPSDNETGSACAAFGRSGETGASSQVVRTKWILEPKGLHETSCGRRFGTRERYMTFLMEGRSDMRNIWPLYTMEGMFLRRWSWIGASTLS